MKIPRIGKFGVAVIAFCLGVGLSLFGPEVFERFIKGKPEESVTELRNGTFKIDVRSQEFRHSGIRNIDICVAEAANSRFPEKQIQCLLHGYDFSGLSVNWKSEREIEIFFDCGRVSSFANSAVVSRIGSLPVEFNAILRDRCNAGSKE
jgi:hypothetical protein